MIFIKKTTVMFLLLISGCTCTITMVHTSGEASDVVDETSSNTPSVELDLQANQIP